MLANRSSPRGIALACAAAAMASQLVCARVALAEEAPAASDTAVRKYLTLRHEEDWSFLRDYKGRRDTFDSLKYVPLNGDGSIWFSTGAQLRERVEMWKSFNFDDTPGAKSDDVYLLQRILVHGDLHVTDHFRLFVQGKSALATDRDLPGGRRPSDEDDIDLQNGFAEAKAPTLGPVKEVTLRAGRQELSFGRERLVSPLDWTNTRRTFDDITLSGIVGGWKVTSFVSHIVNVKEYSTNDHDLDSDFHGIYATNADVPVIGLLDLYYFYLARNDVTFSAETGDEDRHTLGARLFGPIAETIFDYEVEVDYQAGEVGEGDINAMSLSTVIGATIPEDEWSPRLELTLDYATGDETPGDGDAETFNQLFPLGHAYFGFIDYVGRQNIMHVQSMALMKPLETTTLRLDLHYFWRASDEDALYDAAGAVLRSGAGTSSRDVGGEIDLTATRSFGNHLALTGGYSHFFAGEFIDQTGKNQDVDFVYFQLQYTM